MMIVRDVVIDKAEAYQAELAKRLCKAEDGGQNKSQLHVLRCNKVSFQACDIASF